MTRWTVYDSNTGETVSRDAGPQDELVEDPTSTADALSSALADPAAVTVLPARTAGAAAILTMRRSPESVQYEPTGFLGVHDQVVLGSKPALKKKWWQKLLG